jgi:hypothetical protein
MAIQGQELGVITRRLRDERLTLAELHGKTNFSLTNTRTHFDLPGVVSVGDVGRYHDWAKHLHLKLVPVLLDPIQCVANGRIEIPGVLLFQSLLVCQLLLSTVSPAEDHTRLLNRASISAIMAPSSRSISL